MTDTRTIALEPLTAAVFARFGDVIECAGTPDRLINEGLCSRYHDLARIDCDRDGGRAGVSMFRSQRRPLPYGFKLVERHPLGSQTFIPMSCDPFMVIVADDEDGRPGVPKAYLTRPGQGVNYRRNVWHGVLAPLVDQACFAVIDRIGPGSNLEEYTYEAPWTIISQ